MNKSFVLLSFGAALMALTACDMYAPDTVTRNRLQVQEQTFVDQVPVSQADTAYVDSMSRAYTQSGRGKIDLTVTYDPASKTNTAMKAGDEASRIAKEFRRNGVSDVVTSVLPVREQGGEGLVIISFTSFQASAPKDCDTMPGFDSTDVDHNEQYKIGCTVETVFARQIANPADLLGNARGTPTTDGRISSNVVEQYRVGAPNKPLKGEQASE